MSASSLPKSAVSALALASLLLFTVVGCDGAGEDGGRTGTLQVMLTDAPFPFESAEAANVTIERVVALPASDSPDVEENNRFVLTDETQSFNLLELRDGVTAPLAGEELPAGTYEQIRLILGEEASVVMDDGTTYDLQVPSGTQTGVKVLLEGLDISAGEETELTLDFDVSKSFVTKGNPGAPGGVQGFLFKPVVTVERIDE
ncbi:MAG: hypothetical protein BRD48_05125 [Bacteroidetes bacterium QS_9_68_14]|nr:MAG: hypothetical protein BRD48_05125 [Bacteroidetes bacterium QS_9_68_14]